MNLIKRLQEAVFVWKMSFTPEIGDWVQCGPEAKEGWWTGKVTEIHDEAVTVERDLQMLLDPVFGTRLWSSYFHVSPEQLTHLKKAKR